jgi:hypothetical protein
MALNAAPDKAPDKTLDKALDAALNEGLAAISSLICSPVLLFYYSRAHRLRKVY